MSFSGFPPDGLAFLRDLAQHNDRTWFQANKPRYEAGVLSPLRALLADLATRFAATDLPLTADPIKAVFRIHRDIRFSRDKRPYKTQAGAVMTRDGAKNTPGVLYIHIDPGGCFAACGFYQPEPQGQAALRAAIVERPAAFQAVLDGLRGAGLDLSRDDALARMPRGLEHLAASPHAEMLRLRNLVTSRPIPAARLGGPALVDEIDDFARLALPLLTFGWTALREARA